LIGFGLRGGDGALDNFCDERPATERRQQETQGGDPQVFFRVGFPQTIFRVSFPYTVF
jgi:hypothetical protein